MLLRPPRKNLCEQPPTPLEIASFLTSPSPLGISVALRRGLWIFFGTTHYTCQREAVEGRKSVKILQAKQPCYKKYYHKSDAGVSIQSFA